MAQDIHRPIPGERKTHVVVILLARLEPIKTRGIGRQVPILESMGTPAQMTQANRRKLVSSQRANRLPRMAALLVGPHSLSPVPKHRMRPRHRQPR
jgi:hypothetical protein